MNRRSRVEALSELRFHSRYLVLTPSPLGGSQVVEGRYKGFRRDLASVHGAPFSEPLGELRRCVFCDLLCSPTGSDRHAKANHGRDRLDPVRPMLTYPRSKGFPHPSIVHPNPPDGEGPAARYLARPSSM